MKWTGDLAHFPYPFKDSTYRYSNNSIPMKQPFCIEVTPSYKKEMLLKRKLLSDHPERCYQSLPHSITGQWEIVEFVIDHLVSQYPQHFSVEKENNSWIFFNKILDEKVEFIFGDENSLSCEPLFFISHHVQEDLIYMRQRDDNLYLDAGQLCFPANWSLAFNIGMKFKNIHHPIPGFKEEGLDQRILQFLMRLEAGTPWERLNWSLMAGDRLDTSLETFDQWGKLRKHVTRENAGELVHIRVEVQKLFRLPRTNSILFSIHTHLLSFEQLSTNREWLQQFYEILSELHAHIVEYKGISTYKKAVLEYLEDQLQQVKTL
ncbi:heme-dependent oxidative N-demethylase family protein [Fictibacillus phosphorivorans]|uniref:heme-dependent oxidative N-demethylase family protein n=1 Tax=Fictibacillus phosphorivorans TaxID=1221500 RepID=UPI0035EF01A3